MDEEDGDLKKDGKHLNTIVRFKCKEHLRDTKFYQLILTYSHLHTLSYICTDVYVCISKMTVQING